VADRRLFLKQRRNTYSTTALAAMCKPGHREAVKKCVEGSEYTPGSFLSRAWTVTGMGKSYGNGRAKMSLHRSVEGIRRSRW